MPPEAEAILDVQSAAALETRAGPRYRWSCWDRGPGRSVIFQLTISGAGIFRLGERELRVPAGSAFLSMVPERASYYCVPGASEPWVFSWVNFGGPFAFALWRKVRRRHGPVLDFSGAEEIARGLARLAKRSSARGFRDRFEAGVAWYEWYLACIRALERSGAGDPVERAVEYCRAHFREPVSVKELAASCGMSREHFTRVFTARAGVPPGELVRSARADAAAELVRETPLPFEQIAMRCGYLSARHLAKAFRARFGAAPSQVRRAAQEGAG